ncbi:MAG TPA: hydrogenase maturation protease [Syntrophobacteraceae bacterium]|nr:hydrogenase maturation protease [Syntrophobacteraceae bacterium]
MKTLILGMGNPILSDDGVGLAIAQRLRDSIRGVDVAFSSMIGLDLFDLILGYDAIFIIDAMTTKGGEAGELKKILGRDRCGTLHLFSSHGLNIFELMELGLRCGFEMPHLKMVYGIEIGSETAFGGSLSTAMNEKLPAIIEQITADLISLIPSLIAIADRVGLQ